MPFDYNNTQSYTPPASAIRTLDRDKNEQTQYNNAQHQDLQPADNHNQTEKVIVIKEIKVLFQSIDKKQDMFTFILDGRHDVTIKNKNVSMTEHLTITNVKEHLKSATIIVITDDCEHMPQYHLSDEALKKYNLTLKPDERAVMMKIYEVKIIDSKEKDKEVKLLGKMRVQNPNLAPQNQSDPSQQNYPHTTQLQSNQYPIENTFNKPNNSHDDMKSDRADRDSDTYSTASTANDSDSD